MTKRKLHILFINSWYPSRVLPTNGDFIQRHVEAVALKHKVTAIHVITDNSIKNEVLSDENINGVRTLIAYLKPTKNNISKQFQFFRAYKKLISLSKDFDIVHVNRLFPVGIIAVWLKINRNIPYIISEHFSGYQNRIGKSELLISKIIARQANLICPVSEDLSKNMQVLGLKGNYKVVPNVIDTTIFTPTDNINKVFTLIHVSSLVDDIKNISGILNVIGQLQNHIPNFLFYLVGDNPFQYQSLIDSLNIDSKNIKLIDQIPHREVATYIQNSDIMLMFSNYESFSCVIKEAFSCGIKVISTDVGGINEYFPNDFGKLIPVKNEKELLDSILSLNDKTENNQKNIMHQYIENHFSKEIISSDFSNIYQDILTKNL